MARYKKATLSDEKEIDVRILGLFELDDVIIPLQTGPYTIQIQIGTQTYRQAFDIGLFDSPPKKPQIRFEEVEEKSQAWYDWQTHLQYQEALLFEQECRLDALRYYADIRDYIMKMCVETMDRPHIISPFDWEAVVSVALIPELTLQDLIATSTRTHRATFDDENVLVAILQHAAQQESEGSASVAIPKAWELETINALQYTEEAYAALSIQERARKVVTHKLADWQKALQAEKRDAQRPVQVSQTPS